MLRWLKTAIGQSQAVRQWHTRRLLRWSIKEPAALVLSRAGRYARHEVETVFRSRSGAEIPVLRGYRYSMTPILSHLPPMPLLEGLDRENRLTAAERTAYLRALGERALAAPYGEVLALVGGLLPRVKDRLVPEHSDDPERAELMPDAQTLARRLAEEVSILRWRLIRVRQFATPLQDGCRVLEIGYTTGGYSINAWHRLGFDITGIDNAYDGTAPATTVHRHIAERLRTKPHFVFGDMTKRTELPDAAFDIVYSVSVLEHVSDIDGLMAECRRLLRPGGLMIHGWNPYFSANGGHPWGLLDAPWGHLRIPESELADYLDRLRPHEAPVSGPWVRNTMDRNTTLSAMQATVTAAGFRLLLWDQVPEDPATLGDLTNEVLAQVRAAYPHVTLADMTTRDALMVARKE